MRRDPVIKPDELLEYMKSQLKDEQRADEKIAELLPVIVRGIIKAVQSSVH
jgi:hypothetical protein